MTLLGSPGDWSRLGRMDHPDEGTAGWGTIRFFPAMEVAVPKAVSATASSSRRGTTSTSPRTPRPTPTTRRPPDPVPPPTARTRPAGRAKQASVGVAAAQSVAAAATGRAAHAATWGVGALRGSARAVGGALHGPVPDADRGGREPLAGVSVTVPFVSASLRLPGPGAVATVGPVRLTLPTGALYYGGLAALVVGGTLELPVAAGAALAGAVLGRRWLRRPVPGIDVFDAQPLPAHRAGSAKT